MSVKVNKKGTVRFAYTPQAPAKTVSVTGSFSGWEPIRMRKQKNGEYVANVQVPFGTHEYKFIVDDIWHVDPENELQSRNPFGTLNSVLTVL